MRQTVARSNSGRLKRWQPARLETRTPVFGVKYGTAGAASPVVIDPLVRFGRPAVHGVTTERLWELFDAGETIDQIIVGYDLPEPDVRAAIAYEEQLRSLAA